MGATELQINAGKETEINSMTSEESTKNSSDSLGEILVLGEEKKEKGDFAFLLHNQAVTLR